MRCFLVSLLAAAAFAASAQTNPPVQTKKMTLDDCIQLAVERNLGIQIDRFRPELARYSLSIVSWAYDPTLNLSGGHSYDRSAGGLDDQNRRYAGAEQDANSFSASLDGLTPWGLRYSLGGSVTDRYGNRPSFTDSSTVITNSSGEIITNIIAAMFREPFENVGGRVGIFQASQPLLRDFLIDQNRLNIRLGKQELKKSEWALRDTVMAVVNQVENAYFELIGAQDFVQVQKSALGLAERQLSENRKRVEVGQMAPLDEKQAAAQAAQRKADLISALGAEDTRQRALKNLITDDYSDWKDTRIEPLEKLVALPEIFDLQESWRRGLTQRPDLVQMKVELESQGYRIKYAKNQLLPEFNVVGTAGWNASGQDIDEAFGQVRGRENPFWSVQGQFGVPLFNRAAKDRYRSSRLTGEQLGLQLKQLQQGILISIEDDIAAGRTAFELVHARREQRAFAEEALWAGEQKLASGKSTTFEVLELQDKLTQARNAEIVALTAYNKSLAKLALDEGSTLDRRRVTIQVK